jgi:hypothetical protein
MNIGMGKMEAVWFSSRRTYGKHRALKGPQKVKKKKLTKRRNQSKKWLNKKIDKYGKKEIKTEIIM